MKLNKYLSFDISLHNTLFQLNKEYPYTHPSYITLLNTLESNWISKGYSSTSEERTFKSTAYTTMNLYYMNPLDKGSDIVLLNKFINISETSQFRCCRIDKLHFLNSNELELIDYKSGMYIPPPIDSFYTQKSLLTVTSIKNKFGVYPDIYSFYYLRRGIKKSLHLDSDYIFILNKL